MAERLPVVILGAGAIGCAVAAAIVQAGGRPTIATRHPFERLNVTMVDEVVTAVVPQLASPQDAQPVDVVILAVKAHQTPGVAEWLGALVDQATTVYILQNGVEHIDRVRPFVPAGVELVPTVVALPAERSAPGVVVVSQRSRLTVPAGSAADRLHKLVDGSTVEVRESENWLTPAWTKLMMNAASGGICVLAQRDNGLFGADAEAAELAISLMQEVASVGRAEGAVIADDLPERIMDNLQRVSGGHLSSIVVDRINGVGTEWDARNAVVARIAARHGIEVPLNKMLTTLIRITEPQD